MEISPVFYPFTIRIEKCWLARAKTYISLGKLWWRWQL